MEEFLATRQISLIIYIDVCGIAAHKNVNTGTTMDRHIDW